jgi:hypothetical protein
VLPLHGASSGLEEKGEEVLRQTMGVPCWLSTGVWWTGRRGGGRLKMMRWWERKTRKEEEPPTRELTTLALLHEGFQGTI